MSCLLEVSLPDTKFNAGWQRNVLILFKYALPIILAVGVTCGLGSLAVGISLPTLYGLIFWVTLCTSLDVCKMCLEGV